MLADTIFLLLSRRRENHICKGSFDQKLEDIVIAAVGSKEDVEKALPVSAGDRLEVVVEEPHVSNSRDGIARLEGYVIDVEGAGRLIGRSFSFR